MALDRLPRHLPLDCPACGEEDVRHEVLKGRVKSKGEGFTMDLFRARTGIDPARILGRVEEAESRGLIDTGAGRVVATPLGYRFLNDLVSLFVES